MSVKSNAKQNILEIDSIQASTGGGFISILNVKRYSTPFSLDNDLDLAYKSWVLSQIAVGIVPEYIKIPAGTTIPFNINMTTGSRPGFGLRPTILRQIVKNIGGTIDDTKLMIADDILPIYNYTDNTYSALSSIDIYGHDDGTGNFAEDTFITIKT